ncbi:AimR family lysis-lysogeny pheromone receptor [Bacillus thuringiensis]|uniref:AimR family lysis-lysogeny pheromone receptor n=1 Tax=Bacillus thuringiensis TaxID=1428 RepID=UPI0021D68F92|nr:AimR family lysis-lysogeny pheromone receptor [Bacillus thuringiensis]MCU7667285.1 AimR family lysis-lysogeny pheromone receptor [Bacillus thuringiensis]
MDTVIKKILEKQNINANELAKRINITPGTLSKFLNKKVEIGFSTILSIIMELIPEEELELMDRYARVCEKPENIRMCMEYAARHQMTGLLRFLVGKAKKMKNYQTVELSKVYELYEKVANGEFLGNSPELGVSFKITYEESAILFRIMFIYNMYIHRKFDYLFFVAKNLEGRIDKLPNSYIKESFEKRVYMIFSNAYRYNYDMEKCREYSYRIIQSPYSRGKAAGDACYNIGMSYLFEDAEKSLFFMRDSIKAYNEFGFENDAKQIKESIIPFIKNFYNLYDDESSIEEPEEIAHYYAKNGKSEEALQILNKLEESPYTDYLKGLCYTDEKGVEYLYKSMIFFERCGDKFCAQLPKLELVKRGKSWAAY